MVRVAVVGCGYWGPNLIRNFWNCPLTELVAICDKDQSRLEQVLRAFPVVKPVSSFEKLLEMDSVEAIAIATPVGTHFKLGGDALKAGKHVLVEKPLAGSLREAEELVALADEHKRILMVDHVFVYSEPVRKIKELVDSGELGEILYIDSVRINLGLFQHDVNVVWDLAPHDLSIVDYLLGRPPKSVAAYGSCHTKNEQEIEDVAYLNLDFGDSLIATFHVNWLSPVKVRHLIIGGSRQSLVYNDLDAAERVKVYNRGIEQSFDPESRRETLIQYRSGDVYSPHIPSKEPLQAVVTHFAESIRNGSTPLTDGRAGLRVVQMLDAAQRSIKAQGGRIGLY